ncbi:MAG: hypothetical protein KJT03_11110, partial [Verrucomicrobiae bacterium]|nr:hypothetical protein [Verrucomicrobiae bacterium]
KPLGTFTTFFTVGVPDNAEGPHVVSSYPPSNATDVDPWVDTVEFTFSEPMLPTGGFLSNYWYPWTLTWSDDRLTAYLHRGSAGTPLYSASVMLKPLGFYSLSSVPMEVPYELRFRTAAPQPLRVDPDPGKGFYWPYFLLIPSSVNPPATLLVEPNNTGTWGDDPWFHEDAASKLVAWRASFTTELGSPLLVPVFPRPVHPTISENGGIYIHALDRYSLDTRWTGLQRIDLQMVAMIDDALDRLRGDGYAMDDKVFMMGFSASGAFTSRFAAIHPERVKATAPGSPGGWPIVPVSDWEGTSLKYPTGIEDLQSLTGQAFNLEAFRQIPQFIYVGDIDTNDAFDVRGLTEEEKNDIRAFLNSPADPIIAHRWPLAQEIYDSVGSQAEFVTYPGVAHTITEAMFDEIRTFFAEHR